MLSGREHSGTHQTTAQFFCLQSDPLSQVSLSVCFLRAMADIRNGKNKKKENSLSLSPAPLLSPGVAQGVIGPSKAGSVVLFATYVCMYVCAPVCVSACVPIFPPCGQVTIANQACEPPLKRAREGERRGDWGEMEQMSECFPLSSSLKQR